MTPNGTLSRPLLQKRVFFFLKSDIMDLRHQSSAMSKRHWRSIQNARTNKKAKIRTTNPRGRTCHLQSARLLLHWRSRPIRVKGNQADSRKTERQKGGFLLWVGGSRSKERDRKSELVLRSTYQIF